jgi:hypothetical protein
MWSEKMKDLGISIGVSYAVGLVAGFLWWILTIILPFDFSFGDIFYSRLTIAVTAIFLGGFLRFNEDFCQDCRALFDNLKNLRQLEQDSKFEAIKSTLTKAPRRFFPHVAAFLVLIILVITGDSYEMPEISKNSEARYIASGETCNKNSQRAVCLTEKQTKTLCLDENTGAAVSFGLLGPIYSVMDDGIAMRELPARSGDPADWYKNRNFSWYKSWKSGACYMTVRLKGTFRGNSLIGKATRKVKHFIRGKNYFLIDGVEAQFKCPRGRKNCMVFR